MANLEKYYVIHTYEAQHPDEVTLYIHDQVAVIEKDERYNDGWWLGKSCAGKIGLFPANYVTKITENKKILNTKVIQRNTIESLNQPTLNSNAIREWTPEQVSLWILQIGFDHDIAYNFKDQEISGDVLLELTLESLKELEVSTFGKRFKLLAAINVLREESRRRRAHNARSNREAKNSKPKVYPNEKRALDDISTITRANTSFKPLTRSYTSGDLKVDRTPRQLLKKTSGDEFSRKPLAIRVGQEEFNRKTLKNVPEEVISSIPAIKEPEKASPKSSIRIDDFRNIKPQLDSSASHCEAPKKSLVTEAADPVGDRMSQLYITAMKDDKGVPDMDGWLYKQGGEKYKTWNKRWFVLKGSMLFYFKRPKSLHVKGVINLKGYKIEVDEAIHPGSYCFKAHHERERTFYFYVESEKTMKDWLKALIKATISRDYTAHLVVQATSSNMIPTVSLEAAQKMRPRPPSSILYCRAK